MGLAAGRRGVEPSWREGSRGRMTPRARMRPLGVGVCGSLTGDQPQGASMSPLRRPPRPDNLVEVASRLDETLHELRQLVAWLVLEGHDRGVTWDEIGQTFGVSRQAAHERFGPNSRALRRGEHGR